MNGLYTESNEHPQVGKAMRAIEVSNAAREQAAAIAALIYSIREAVQAYQVRPIDGLEFSARAWCEVAIPLLSQDLRELQPCISNPATPENARTMLRISRNQLGMSKNLDAFRWDFAGYEHENAISSRVDDTVGAAATLIKALANKS